MVCFSITALSLKSHSSSTPQCSDSDCTFEHCKLAKRSTNDKANFSLEDDSAHYDQYDPQSKRLNAHFYTLRDENRNKESVRRAYKFMGSISNQNSVLRIPPGFEWKDVNFSKGVQQIPPFINKETRLGLSDVQLFANVMRGGRRNVGNFSFLIEILNVLIVSIWSLDTTYLDVVTDPIVSQFFWNTMGTNVLDHFPDLLYLRQQLGRRIKEHIDKHSRDHFNFAAQRNSSKITINDLPHINQILIDTKSRPKAIDDNAFGIDRTSMYKCRRSDPYMVTIQTAIYSEPQPLPINFHKAAEDFALLSYPNSEVHGEEIKIHGNLSETRNTANGFSFKPNAVSFKPSLSSTPIKNHPQSNEIQVMAAEPLMSSFSGYTNVYQQHASCPSSHMFVPWYNQQNSVFLYPQTLLMTSPKAPRVYPDMTNE